MSTTGNEDVQETSPGRLYHYTSLESLALILENRTIRLMPIEGMDDLQESRTSDVPNLGRFIFASSWTDDSVESIPMWNMYASLETGVRICLPTMPFKRYRHNAEEYAQQLGIPVSHIDLQGDTYETFLPPSDLAKGLASYAFLDGRGVLIKVQYTSDKSLLEPKVLFTEGDHTRIDIGVLGKYKNEYWAFQHEWRYQMCIIPFSVLDMSGDIQLRLQVMMNKMLMGTLAAPCPYYDLHISDEAMMELEVVASPKMSAGNRILLDLLLEKHGLGCCLKASALTGLI